MRGLVWPAAALALLAASPAGAETRTLALADVGTMVSPEGMTRFLVGPSGPIDVGNLSIGSAVLGVPVAAVLLEEDLPVEVWPVDAEWRPGSVSWDAWATPGGDIRREAGGRADVEAGTSRTRLSVDVTGAMRAVVEGEEFHGFLLTVPPGYGEGFGTAHAAALANGLASATLTVTYVTRPPARLR